MILQNNSYHVNSSACQTFIKTPRLHNYIIQKKKKKRVDIKKALNLRVMVDLPLVNEDTCVFWNEESID